MLADRKRSARLTGYSIGCPPSVHDEWHEQNRITSSLLSARVVLYRGPREFRREGEWVGIWQRGPGLKPSEAGLIGCSFCGDGGSGKGESGLCLGLKERGRSPEIEADVQTEAIRRLNLSEGWPLLSLGGDNQNFLSGFF